MALHLLHLTDTIHPAAAQRWRACIQCSALAPPHHCLPPPPLPCLQELLRQAPRETAGTVVQVKSSSKGSGADAGSRGGKGTASSGSGGGSVSLGDGVEISEDEWLALMEAGEALEAEEAAAAASKGRGASSSKSG